MPSMDRVGEIATVLTTPDEARHFLGQSLVLLSSAYEVTNTYDPLKMASGPTKANKQYLDSIRQRAESDYRGLPASGEELPAQQARQIAFDIASIETATNQTLDILGGKTAIEELGGSVVEAGTSIVKGAANAVGGVVPWWLWVLAAGVAIFLISQKVKG